MTWIANQLLHINAIADQRDSSTSGRAKKGRPIKVTSHSKQAIYARSYRQRNKQALLDFEKCVEFQKREIAALKLKNAQIVRELEHMKHNFECAQRLLSQQIGICETLASIINVRFRSQQQKVNEANANCGLQCSFETPEQVTFDDSTNNFTSLSDKEKTSVEEASIELNTGSFIQSSLDSSSDVYWCARSTEISNNSGTSTSAQLRLQPQLMDEKILHVSDTANVATINSENICDATNVDVNSISNEFDSDSSNVRSDGNISKDIARMELEMLDDELAYFDNWILL